jgi:hypothetical protein
MTAAAPLAHTNSAATRSSLLVTLARDHGLWTAIVAVHLLIGALATAAGWLPIRPPVAWESSYTSLLAGLILYWPVCLVAGKRFQGNSWSMAIRRTRAELSLARMAGVAVGTLLVILGLRVHDAWKTAIGRLEPYTWDPLLSELDRRLHFGLYPWQWLAPMSAPATVEALDLLYISWYPLLVLGLVWQIWSADRLTRTRFFIAFALAWVLLGTVLAHLLASAGPVFYGGLVEGSNPYLPLTEYLWRIHGDRPLTAVVLQHIIWKNYIAGAHQVWMGMSAMPSLHLAMPALFACAAWGVSRRLGVAVWSYTLLTLIASVQLGWHYAVDGYASILLVGLIWRLSRRVVGVAEGG